MTAAAKAKIDNLAMGLPPLSVRDLASLVAQVPPVERAALTWAPAAIEAELKRLREEPLNADLVNETSLTISTHLSKALTVIVRALGAPEFLVELKGVYRSESERLDRFLPDPGARRSARWAVQALVGLLEAFPPVAAVRGGHLRRPANRPPDR